MNYAVEGSKDSSFSPESYKSVTINHQKKTISLYFKQKAVVSKKEPINATFD